MAIRTVDLFSGGGGSSYGARAAGAKILCGVDSWEGANAVYAANFGKDRAINLVLDENTSASALGDIGRVDLLLASPECTSHTCARGGRPPDEDSKLTARYVLKFAEDLKPRWVVVENVIHMKGWQGYPPLLAELKKQGYFVRTEVLDAARFGVPQMRKRLFILADRVRIPPRIARRRGKALSAKHILDPEGTWAATPLRDNGRAEATVARADRAIAELGKRKPFLIVYYGSDGAGGWQPLNRPLRTITTLDRFGLVTWDGDTEMLRMLQVPELARAMGFGDDFVLDALKQRRDKIRILGNGVSPPVMQAIVETLTGSVYYRSSRFDFELRAA
jgi:DNA (cytosine-5)-methyltransferase 1